MPQLGLPLWEPYLMHAIFQTLSLALKENFTSHCVRLNPEIHWQVFYAQFGFGEILVWVSLLGFPLGE